MQRGKEPTFTIVIEPASPKSLLGTVTSELRMQDKISRITHMILWLARKFFYFVLKNLKGYTSHLGTGGTVRGANPQPQPHRPYTIIV